MNSAQDPSHHKRLQTFFNRPWPTEHPMSTIKLAEAGFVRSDPSPLTDQQQIPDEVECLDCGAKYSNWSDESPLAVHRILNPNCPFLNSPPKLRSPKQQQQFSESNKSHDDHKKELEKITKLQFPSLTVSSNFFNVADIEQPFRPKNGDYRMLFESLRLLTFSDPLSPQAELYAEAGFIYNIASKTCFCVFCNTEMGFKITNIIELEELHLELFPTCPFVNYYDVGNVSRSVERKIKEKISSELQCNILNNNGVNYLIKHPQYEDETVRCGTFVTWPKILSIAFPPTEMSHSGFFYTGFHDKVMCFACGVGLYDWSAGAVPIQQHALASPHCSFLLDLMGIEMIHIENVKLIVEIDNKEVIRTTQEQVSQSPSLGTMSTCKSALAEKRSACHHQLQPSVGCHLLEMDTVQAAMASGRYPNKDLLLGSLKAVNENQVQLCQKSQEVVKTKAELNVYKSEQAVFQAEKILLHVQQEQLRANKAHFEAERAAYQQQMQDRQRELQRDLIIKKNREDLNRKDQLLREKDHTIEQKDHTIEQNSIELEMKNREVKDLKCHIRSLQAALERQRAENTDMEELSPSLALGHLASQVESPVEEFAVASCKVCLARRSEIMFQPCKHLCCCDGCAAQLLQQGQNCPICREPNLGYEKVYVS